MGYRLREIAREGISPSSIAAAHLGFFWTRTKNVGFARQICLRLTLKRGVALFPVIAPFPC
jgi:hypothetical protein